MFWHSEGIINCYEEEIKHLPSFELNHTCCIHCLKLGHTRNIHFTFLVGRIITCVHMIYLSLLNCVLWVLYVLTCFACFACLACLRALRASKICVLMCFACLCVCVLTCFACLRASKICVLTCFALIVISKFTCQYNTAESNSHSAQIESGNIDYESTELTTAPCRYKQISSCFILKDADHADPIHFWKFETGFTLNRVNQTSLVC